MPVSRQTTMLSQSLNLRLLSRYAPIASVSNVHRPCEW